MSYPPPYPPQGVPAVVGEVVAPKIPINYFKYVNVVGFDWTRRYQPLIAFDLNFNPIHVRLEIHNMDYAYNIEYHLDFIWSDGSTTIIDSGTVPPGSSKVYSKPVHDIEDYLMGSQSLFDRLKDGVHVVRVELYAWFEFTPPRYGQARLYMLGVRW